MRLEGEWTPRTDLFSISHSAVRMLFVLVLACVLLRRQCSLGSVAGKFVREACGADHRLVLRFPGPCPMSSQESHLGLYTVVTDNKGLYVVLPSRDLVPWVSSS